MKTNEQKPKVETRNVKHIFTPAERLELQDSFGGAYDALQSVTADFDAIKSVQKSKVQEAESRMITLRATINAGFEMRNAECVVLFNPPEKKKEIYLLADCMPETNLPKENAKPILVEPMSAQDFQHDLIQAESSFECREEIELFARTEGGPVYTGASGVLVIGRHGGFWSSALRVRIGEHTIFERLDSEQPASKKRKDQINRTLKRFAEWLDEKLGRDTAKGFKNAIELIKAEQAEREE